MNTGGKPNLVRRAALEALPERRHQHQFNSNAVRMTRTLSELTGLQRIGVHQIRLEPGFASTQFHTHDADEEFIYILHGRALAELGELETEVGPGDFIGFPARSPAHALRNPFDADCIYLVGGERIPHDVVHYPRIRRTMLKGPGKRRWLDWDHLNELD